MFFRAGYCHSNTSDVGELSKKVKKQESPGNCLLALQRLSNIPSVWIKESCTENHLVFVLQNNDI